MQGANFNARDKNGRTALIWAAYNTNLDMVQVLIAAGADVNAQDNDGITALMVARAYNRNPDVVKALIAAGAEENFWRNRR